MTNVTPSPQNSVAAPAKPTPQEESRPIEQPSGTLTVDGTEGDTQNEPSDIVKKPGKFASLVNKFFGSVSKTMSEDNDQDYL